MSKKLSFFLLFYVLVTISVAAPVQKATLGVKWENGTPTAWQNGLPYPSFELQSREYMILNGTWQTRRFEADHDLSLKKRNRAVISAMEEEGQGCTAPAFDASGWARTNVPSVNNLRPWRYEDGMWYRREFEFSSDATDKLVRLVFQGANYVTDVWLNGTWIGTHEGGYTPFQFDITSHLKEGKNVLAVRSDNIPWDSSKKIVPYKETDWWNYGGVNRDVYLEITDPVYVVRSDVRPREVYVSQAGLDLLLQVHNSSEQKKSIKVQYRILDAELTDENILSPLAREIIRADTEPGLSGQDGAVVLSGSIQNFRFSVRLNDPRLWSPENPQLYVLETELFVDGQSVEKYYSQFGIRDIRAAKAGRGFLLNHKPIPLNGVARHEDHETRGRAYGFEHAPELYHDLVLVKEMNADFLRTAHYPNHPMTYILADRIGLAIMEEIPVFWFDGPEFDYQRKVRGIARQMWLQMILRDMNRPSILFWSTCNECGWQVERREYIWDCKQYAKMFDGTRMVGQSAVGGDAADPSSIDCDYHGATTYHGVFYNSDEYGDTKDALAYFRANYPSMPYIATEIGIWSQPDWNNSARQIEVADKTIRALHESPSCGGIVWWCIFDWYTMGGSGGYQTMGAMHIDRQQVKPVFMTLQRLYAKAAGPEIMISGFNRGTNLSGSLSQQVSLNVPAGARVQSVSFRFNGTEFSPMAGSGESYSASASLAVLEDGPNALVVRIEMENGDVFYQTRSFTVDSRDDPPEVTFPPLSGRYFMDTLPVLVQAEDDRTKELQVEYSLDGGSYSSIGMSGKDRYRTVIDLSGFTDQSSHSIGLRISDQNNPAQEESFEFNIDRSPGKAVSLAFTVDRISFNQNRSDASGWSFPAEELPESGDWFFSQQGPSKIKFLMGPKEDGQYNAMEGLGQKIKVPPGQYQNLHFLGTSYWGDQDNNLILIYSDGSKETVDLAFSDWVGANPVKEEEYIGYQCAHVHTHEGDGMDETVAMYHRVVPADPERILTAIKLPYDDRKHIFALTMEERNSGADYEN